MSPGEMSEMIESIKVDHEAAIREAVCLIGYSPDSELGARIYDGVLRCYMMEDVEHVSHRDTNVLLRLGLAVATGLGEDVSTDLFTG